jgi:hypothetical protein
LRKRRAWFEAQPDLDPEKLVFIDETWTATNMARTHGRCRRGERLRMGFPHGHRKTTTLVAGLRLGGMVAPMVLDGPINGDWFEAYVAQVLGPTLRPGDVVIMDNLSSHKRASVAAMIEARGARLAFLPPGGLRKPWRVRAGHDSMLSAIVGGDDGGTAAGLLGR